MANPRNIVSFEGLQYQAQTYHTDGVTIVYDRTQPNGSAQVGRAVSMSGPGTVKLAAAGDNIVGKLLSVEADNKGNVQTGGYVDLPGGDGATLTLGSKILGALGASSAPGYIATGAAGRGIIIDPTDPTKVIVRLE